MASKIALVGASQAEESEFHGLLEAAAQRFRQRWEIVGEGDADLVVVDVDSVFGHMTWLKANSVGKRTAAFTTRENARESELLLERPLTLDGVVRLLAQFNVEVSASRAEVPGRTEYASEYMPPGEPAPPPARSIERPTLRAPAESARQAPPPQRAAVSAPAPVPPPAVMPSVQTSRDLSLVDYLTGSLLNGTARLSTPQAPDLVLDPATQTWYSSASGLRPLAAHCERPLSSGDWQALDSAEAAAAKASGVAQPYSRLLWFYTLNQSHGDLLPGLDRLARYKLGRYPQSEREFAKHFRIATFMMKDYATLDEIAEASGAPLTDVIDYVNAYSAIGFVDNDRGKPGESADAAKGGMLSRLRNPFGR